MLADDILSWSAADIVALYRSKRVSPVEVLTATLDRIDRGSRTTSPLPSEEDGPPVSRLRDHGAVFVGKTTTSEFGWKAVADSPLT